MPTFLLAESYIEPGGIAFNLTVFLLGTLLGGLLACILAAIHQAIVGRFFRSLIAAAARDKESARSLNDVGIRRYFGLLRALRAPSSLPRKLVSCVLPDGTVIAPIESLDDEKARREAEKSTIHADEATPCRGESAPPAADNTAAGGDAEAKDAVTAPFGGGELPTGASRGIKLDDPLACRYFLDDLHRRRAEIRFRRRGNEIILLIPTTLVFIALAATLPIYMPHLISLLDLLIGSILGG